MQRLCTGSCSAAVGHTRALARAPASLGCCCYSAVSAGSASYCRHRPRPASWHCWQRLKSACAALVATARSVPCQVLPLAVLTAGMPLRSSSLLGQRSPRRRFGSEFHQAGRCALSSARRLDLQLLAWPMSWAGLGGGDWPSPLRSAVTVSCRAANSNYPS